MAGRTCLRGADFCKLSKWKAIDQSVAGHDFWQCDYDATRKTWQITFTLKPDSKFKDIPALISHPEQREYRFRLTAGGADPPARRAPQAPSEGS